MSVYPIAVATTGSAGSATGESQKNVPYPTRVLAIDLDWHASAPFSSDLTVTCGGRTLLALTNVNTDGVYEVRVQAVKPDGSDLDDPWFVEPYVRGTVTVTVGGSDALDPAVTVRLLTE